jgi:predicted MPP superfamily phosphohydrolase
MTPRQLQYKEAVKEHGGIVAAARALGIDHSVVSRVLNKRAERPEDGPGKRILVLPDVQAKPGVDFSYLRRIGTYALEKRPDIIVCGGDFADFPSLSSYDKGKKAFEGRRYKRDVEAAQFAMQAFLGPIEEHNKGKKTPYKPRMVLVLGNHENRVNRATNDDPMLEGMLSLKDLAYEEYGWEVHDFLEVVIIEGVAFSHYFTSGVMGRPVTTAQALLNKKHMSCVAFHQQGLQIATSHRADGALLTAVICGSAYEHDEDYLGPQGNKHWRGVLMLHAVKDGSYDLMPVSLDYVNRKYADVTYQTPAYSMPTESELAAGRM